MFQLNRRLILFYPNLGQVVKCLVFKRGIPKNSARTLTCSFQHRTKDKNINVLFTPVAIKPTEDETKTGVELVGKLDKLKIVSIINRFYRTPELKVLAGENGLDDYLLHKGFNSFRRYCIETENLPADLHILFSDILNKACSHLDIFPYFLQHIREIFPHLECMEDLKKIGDLRSPANWYGETRKLNRKIIFHCGPTNSGKTYHALERFMESGSGVYCGPLKLLAVEIYNKANEKGTPCDLVTGEEVIHVRSDGDLSNHVSCTVEMCSVEKLYDVAVIDEIQMIKDPQRGWAWTRALLGVRAKEIHLCGEEAVVNLIDSILCTTNEELEVKKYKRLTQLTIIPAVESFRNIQPGDCIVCFNKNDIYKVTQTLESIQKEVAVIYGGLPPGTKLAQCKKFNDPDNSCNILVATDAIGMGLNLSIRRIIFYSLMRCAVNESGELESKTISVSQALQIAGRAGRFGSKYSEGFATTFNAKDLPKLKELLASTPEPVLKAGLIPTIDQIELYSYYLPGSSLSNLVEIFIKLSTVDDSMYFICDVRDFKYLSDMLDHVSLPLRQKFVFCCAPINRKFQFTCTMFLKFAKLYMENRAITLNWLCKNLDWPPKPPINIRHLVQLEATHDILDMYLWLGMRFPDIFPDSEAVKNCQQELDAIIQEGVINMRNLLLNSQRGTSKSDDQEQGENALNNKFLVEFMSELDSEPPADEPKNKLEGKHLSET